MRRIILYQHDSSKIELLDNSTQEIDEYCKELSNLFHMSNVAILKTSEGCTFIGRPSKISGIVVEDIEHKEVPDETPQPEEKEEQIEEQEVDMITDID